jgi:RNA polymerase sigma-70 factor (ECF subfamily)
MVNRDERDDAELARRAAAGCVASFASLATRYQVRIVHYVQQVIGSRGGDADDVAQDAFVRAWRSIASYDDRWAFSTWLFTIARRGCLNHVRATRRRRRRETVAVGESATLADPCTAAVAVERAGRLWDVAAATLSERQFTVLWLRYVEAKSLAEIATVLATPESTVKVLLFRSRRRLAPHVHHLVD